MWWVEGGCLIYDQGHPQLVHHHARCPHHAHPIDFDDILSKYINGPMEYKNTFYMHLEKATATCPVQKSWCFPCLFLANLGKFLDGSSGFDHVGNDYASMYSHRAMESAATETARAGATESQESATTCMACQSWGENMRQSLFFWGGGCGDGYIISGWCQMGNSITEICKISWCFWMAGQPTPRNARPRAYELLVSLNKALVDPYFLGGYVGGGLVD